MLLELLILGLLLIGYDVGRFLASTDIDSAYAVAREVSRASDALPLLPSERTLQLLVLPHHDILEIANSYYALAHWVITGGALLWLIVRRPDVYGWARRALVLASGAALVVYLTLPVAPPRLVPGLGIVDTGKLMGQSVYGNSTTASLANQFAAMPSLHVGWALLVAVVLSVASRSRARWLWFLHPIATTAVVIVTGNHFWLDALAGAGLASLSLVVTRSSTTMVLMVRGLSLASPMGPLLVRSHTVEEGLPSRVRGA